MNEMIHAIVISCLAVFIGAAVFGITTELTVPKASFIEGFK